MARVPLVVVITMTRPATMSGVYSSGELDRWNSGMGLACLSPHSSTRWLPSWRAMSTASSTSLTGMMERTPFCVAVIMTLVARSASTTIATWLRRSFSTEPAVA